MNTDNSDTIKRHKGDKQRPTLKKRFLELLLDEKVLGNVSTAAKILGINRDTVYNWRAKDQKFAKDWDDKKEEANFYLVGEAENALLNGIRAGNATLIIFTLNNRRPEKWNDRFNHARKKEEVTHKLSQEFVSMIERRYGKQWHSVMQARH